jgi:mannose-6-phosphate isomerase-like protein (cupin superfamily)
MADMTSSDLVIDPVRRQRYRFTEADGDLTAEVWTDPGGDVPEHFHPAQTERWEVVTGQVTFRIDGTRRRAGPGDSVLAPAGIRHSFKNTGTVEALLNVHVSPALDLRAFLEEAAALARAGKFNRHSIPHGLAAAGEIADLAERYQHTTVICQPPLRLQHLILPRLAARHRRQIAGTR